MGKGAAGTIEWSPFIFLLGVLGGRNEKKQARMYVGKEKAAGSIVCVMWCQCKFWVAGV